MATISQTTFSDSFYWMKILEFHWNLYPRVHLTINQHWFKYWLVAFSVSGHYLNQCYPSSATHICGTRERWVECIIAIAKCDWNDRSMCNIDIKSYAVRHPQTEIITYWDTIPRCWWKNTLWIHNRSNFILVQYSVPCLTALTIYLRNKVKIYTHELEGYDICKLATLTCLLHSTNKKSTKMVLQHGPKVSRNLCFGQFHRPIEATQW